MELKGDFFQILSTTIVDNGFTSIVSLNPDHIIYKGHFPGHPITPGVIQLQIVHELLEEHMGSKLKLGTISNCKFLRVLDPGVDPIFELDFIIIKTGAVINVKTMGKSGFDTILKLDSVYALR